MSAGGEAPEDGRYKVPALLVLSEITSSLTTEATLDELVSRYLSIMVRVAGALAGTARLLFGTISEHLALRWRTRSLRARTRARRHPPPQGAALSHPPAASKIRWANQALALPQVGFQRGP